MSIDADYIAMLELQREALGRALLNISSDLVRAVMAEYTPDADEMLAVGKWGIGLFDALGIDKSTIKDWQTEDE